MILLSIGLGTTAAQRSFLYQAFLYIIIRNLREDLA